MREYKGSSAYEVTSKRLYAPCTLLERVITLPASVVEILPNNPRRLSWQLCNRDTAPIYFGFSADVRAETGFYLDANGGFASMSVEEDGEAVGYSVYALSASGAATIRVMEVVTL